MKYAEKDFPYILVDFLWYPAGGHDQRAEVKVTLTVPDFIKFTTGHTMDECGLSWPMVINVLFRLEGYIPVDGTPCDVRGDLWASYVGDKEKYHKIRVTGTRLRCMETDDLDKCFQMRFGHSLSGYAIRNTCWKI